MPSNPWSSLADEPPFIADVDRRILESEWRDGTSWQKRYELECDVLPHAWIGNPLTARVLILQLNPGWDDQDRLDEEAFPDYRSTARRCLQLDPTLGFFFLVPPLDATAGGKWWRQKLSGLVPEPVQPAAAVSGMAAVEYFPYHSRNYTLPPRLPSQDFAFQLVRKALKNDPFVLVMRQWESWRAAVPELIDYTRKAFPRSTQQASISENNLGSEAFREVVAALSG